MTYFVRDCMLDEALKFTILKCPESGVLHLGLLGFRILSIVQYSKENIMFRRLDSLPSSGGKLERHLLSRVRYERPTSITKQTYICEVHSAVGIATVYGLDNRWVGVRVPVGSRIFSSPRRPDRIWGPPSLLSNGYGGKAAGA
jgi:hypothetical protein